MIRALIFATLLLVAGFGSPPRAVADDSAPAEISVGTKEAPPFAMKGDDGEWRGVSIDLWRRVADKTGLHYKFVEVPTVQALIDGVANRSFDAAIAAITITAAREQTIDFSEPFYNTGLGVAVPVSESTGRAVLRALSSFGFLQAVGALLGIAVIIGVVVWAIERRHTHTFQGGAKGLGAGIWWSAIAMVQAGASQNAPATLVGRVVAVSWMIASIIALAVFTAGITSTLTKRELQGAVQKADDLRSVRVGAVAGSSSIDWLDRQRMAHRTYPNPNEGLKAVQSGALDAFVYDKPLLTWLILQNFSATLRVLDMTLGSQSYAVALPPGSPLRQKINAPMLAEVESDWWRQTLFQYLGAQPGN